MPDLLSTAERYARAGWPVFPCRPDAKAPLTRHGFTEATTDLDTIRAWWTRWPDANIGIATGAPGPDVLDIDVKDGAPGMRSLHRLRAAGAVAGAFAMIRTWSGGLHLYYTGTSQRSSSRKRHGIDFRSSGGYVIAPPSTVEGKPYEVVEHRPYTGRTLDWQNVCTILDPPRPATPTMVDPFTPTSALASWCERKLAELLAAPVAVGERSERFHEMVGLARKAGYTEQQAVAALTPWCERVGKYVGRVDREVARSWDKKARALA